jgi:hypothetical protein
MTLDQSEDVSVLMLDEFCRMEQLQRIHFLKLDVEGHEPKVLHGAHELLERGALISSSSSLVDAILIRGRIYMTSMNCSRPAIASTGS